MKRNVFYSMQCLEWIIHPTVKIFNCNQIPERRMKRNVFYSIQCLEWIIQPIVKILTAIKYLNVV
jgi:uncharacterized membrane protein